MVGIIGKYPNPFTLCICILLFLSLIPLFLIFSFITRVISVVFGMIIQKCDPGHKCSVIRLSTYPTLVAHYMFLFFCFLMHLLPLCRLTLMPFFLMLFYFFNTSHIFGFLCFLCPCI